MQQIAQTIEFKINSTRNAKNTSQFAKNTQNSQMRTQKLIYAQKAA